MNTKTTAFARRAAVFVAAAGVALGSAFWAADYLRAQYYAAPAGAAAASTGSASLRAAIKRLGTLESASATITFSLFFEGREYPGSGSYAELSSPNRTLRGENYFKLSAALDDSESPYSLNVVCDGRGSKVWNTKTLGNTTSESRIDLEVIDDWQTTFGPSSETALDASDKSATATPGLGGLAGVLRRLESSYRFQDEVERIDAADGERVKIIGEISEKLLKRLMAERRLPVSDEDFERRVPKRVEITFSVVQIEAGEEREIWLPRTIEYFTTTGGAPELLFRVSYDDYKLNQTPYAPNAPEENAERFLPDLKNPIQEPGDDAFLKELKLYDVSETPDDASEKGAAPSGDAGEN